MSNSPSKSPEIGRRSLIAIRILALIATAVSAYLAWVTFTHGTIAACDGQASQIACDHVLRSSWSSWLGIPVSLFGSVVYFLIFLASWAIEPKSIRFRKAAWSILPALVTLAAGSAFWFLFLQVFVIGKFCSYCLGIHTCGVVILALFIVPAWLEKRRQWHAGYVEVLRRTTLGSTPAPMVALEKENRGGNGFVGSVTIALLGLIVLVAGQLLFPSTTFEVRDAESFTATTIVDEQMEGRDGSDDDRVPVSTGSVDSLVAQASTLPTSEPSPTTNRDDAQDSEDSSRPVPVSSTPSHDAKSGSDTDMTRPISLLEGKLILDVHEHSLLGSPAAEHVIVELVDYTCKDCRKLHQYLKKLRANYGDRLAIIVLPVPLESNCNPHIQRTHPDHVGACKYARLAIAVSRVDNDMFEEFHDWMMDSKLPPSLEDAVRKASELVDRDLLLEEINGDRVRKRLDFHIQLFHRVGRFPATIVGDGIIVGVPNTAEEFLAVIKKRLGSMTVPQ